MKKFILVLTLFLCSLDLVNSGSLRATHFWDCSGMGCDATTLSPWDKDKYVASPGYSPQDPNDHGGAVYGEKLWMVGAASDDLANKLGSDDGCCGRDNNSKGCGKCILVSNDNAVNKNWKAIVMKKNRCPPEATGCEWGKDHMDMAVPGYDVEQYSLANVCATRQGTGFTKRSDSFICGEWYKSYSNTQGCKSKCQVLPSQLRKGCELFSSWGWKTGNPMLTYQVVACPQRFKDWVKNQFGPDGVKSSSSGGSGTTPTTTTSSPTTKAPTTSGTSGGGSTNVKVTNNNVWYCQLLFSFVPSSVNIKYKDTSGNYKTVNLQKSSWSSKEWFKSLPSQYGSGKITVTAVGSGKTLTGQVDYIKSTSTSLSTTSGGSNNGGDGDGSRSNEIQVKVTTGGSNSWWFQFKQSSSPEYFYVEYLGVKQWLGTASWDPKTWIGSAKKELNTNVDVICTAKINGRELRGVYKLGQSTFNLSDDTLVY